VAKNTTAALPLKVFAGHYDNCRIILACRSKDEFLALTSIPKSNFYGTTANAGEIAVAMKRPGTSLARNIRSLDGEFLPWTKPSNNEIKKRKELEKQSAYSVRKLTPLG